MKLTTAQAIVRYLVAQRTVDRRRRGAAVPGRLRDLRARQRHLPRPGAGGGTRRAADVARPERAGDGAGRGRLRQGDAAPPDHGRHVVDRSRRAQHGHRRRRRPRQPAAACCCWRATRSRAGSPIRCCSRSSTSAIRRSPSTTRSSRSAATGTASRGPSRSCTRCRTRWRRCSTRRTAGRRSSPCRRTSRPRRSTTPTGSSSATVHEIAATARRSSSSCARAAERRSATPTRPLIIAGGGVHYSGAEAELHAFAEHPQHPRRRDGGRQGVACWPPIRSTPDRSASPDARRRTRSPPRPMSSSPSAPACRTSRPVRGRRSRRRQVRRHQRRRLRRREALAARRSSATPASACASWRRSLDDWSGPERLVRTRRPRDRRPTTPTSTRSRRRPRAALPTYAQVVGAIDRARRADATTRWRRPAGFPASSTTAGGPRVSTASTASTASRAWATRSPGHGGPRWRCPTAR